MIKQHVINTLRSATTVFVAQDKDGGGLALHPSNVLVLIDSLQHQLIQKDREMSHVSERLKFIDDGMDKTVAGFDRVVAQRDDLKKQLAERDRTIAQLQEMNKLHNSGAKQLTQDLHVLRVDRDKLQEALEQVQHHLREGYIISAESIVDEALGRE